MNRISSSRMLLPASVMTVLFLAFTQCNVSRFTEAQDVSGKVVTMKLNAKEPVFVIPEKKNIQKMVAQLYERSNNRSDLPEFIVPDRFYDDFLQIFGNLELDPEPDVMSQEIGTIHIWYGVTTVRLCLFENVLVNGYGLSWNGFRVRIKNTSDEWAAVKIKKLLTTASESAMKQ